MILYIYRYVLTCAHIYYIYIHYQSPGTAILLRPIGVCDRRPTWAHTARRRREPGRKCVTSVRRSVFAFLFFPDTAANTPQPITRTPITTRPARFLHIIYIITYLYLYTWSYGLNSFLYSIYEYNILGTRPKYNLGPRLSVSERRHYCFFFKFSFGLSTFLLLALSTTHTHTNIMYTRSRITLHVSDESNRPTVIFRRSVFSVVTSTNYLKVK